MLRTTVCAAAAAVAAAQGFGITGQWEHVQPNVDSTGYDQYPGCPVGQGPTCIGPIPLWHKAIFVGNGFYVAGTDSTGAAHLWGFDVAQQVWRPYAASQAGFASADLEAFGGYVLGVGGSTDQYATSLAYMTIDVGQATPTWNTLAVGTQPASHVGHRMIVVGGILYMMGGGTTDPTQGWMWSNAVWAIDLNTAFVSAIPQNWVQLQSASTSIAWSGRGGFTLIEHAGRIYLFGGVTHNANLAPPPAGKSICASAGAGCTVMYDIWEWAPGIPTGPLTNCGISGCGWFARIPQTTTVPPGRFDHAAAASGHHMYIFGGSDANGNYLTDLWAYNFQMNAWSQVQSTFYGFSGFSPQQWAPSMATVGYQMYVEATGDNGGNAIYVWTPADSMTPHFPGGSGNSNSNSGPTSGQTAGAVIGILVGLTNMGFLIFLAITLKAFAACSFCPGFCRGGQAPKVDGFYTSAKASSAGDAYAPPAM